MKKFCGGDHGQPPPAPGAPREYQNDYRRLFRLEQKALRELKDLQALQKRGDAINRTTSNDATQMSTIPNATSGTSILSVANTKYASDSVWLRTHKKTRYSKQTKHRASVRTGAVQPEQVKDAKCTVQKAAWPVIKVAGKSQIERCQSLTEKDLGDALRVVFSTESFEDAASADDGAMSQQDKVAVMAQFFTLPTEDALRYLGGRASKDYQARLIEYFLIGKIVEALPEDATEHLDNDVTKFVARVGDSFLQASFDIYEDDGRWSKVIDTGSLQSVHMCVK